MSEMHARRSDARPRRIHRNRKGAAAIEFALCMTFVLLPLLAAILEWSWYFYQEIRVMRVGRDAARVGVSASISPDNRTHAATDWAEMRLAEMSFDTSDDGVEVSLGTETINVGGGTRDLLLVTLNVPFEAVTGLLPAGLSPPDHLNSVYAMVAP